MTFKLIQTWIFDTICIKILMWFVQKSSFQRMKGKWILFKKFISLLLFPFQQHDIIISSSYSGDILAVLCNLKMKYSMHFLFSRSERVFNWGFMVYYDFNLKLNPLWNFALSLWNSKAAPQLINERLSHFRIYLVFMKSWNLTTSSKTPLEHYRNDSRIKAHNKEK